MSSFTESDSFLLHVETRTNTVHLGSLAVLEFKLHDGITHEHVCVHVTTYNGVIRGYLISRETSEKQEGWVFRQSTRHVRRVPFEYTAGRAENRNKGEHRVLSRVAFYNEISRLRVRVANAHAWKVRGERYTGRKFFNGTPWSLAI